MYLPPHPILYLQMETASLSNGTRYYVMAVTPTRLYSFTGFGSLDVSLSLVFSIPAWMKLVNVLQNEQ